MTAKRFFKKGERTTLFAMKLLLFCFLFFVFFLLFSFDNPQIIKLSRTAAITMTTFVIVGFSMTVVYGGFAIGKKKSKEIISSLGIATVITDVITYFQLSIMNTNPYNEAVLTFNNIWILGVVIIIQVLITSLFVYLGNFLYFKINPPENCVVVCDDTSRAHEILAKIAKYKKQYKVTNVVSYEDEWKPLVHQADSVFIYRVPPKEKDEIIEYAYKHYTNLYINTEVSDIVVNYAKYTMLDDLSVLCSNVKSLSFEQRFIKRALDIFVAGIALIVFSPVMLIEAICIKAYDKGPILFKQKRATLDSKVFNVLKFRTMIVDADKGGYRPASDHDDRITPVGKVIRKLRIDELPQFINIIRGDMSIVGPRPERIEHVEKYTNELPEFKYRLRAKAGLTGLAQIAGKYNTTPKDKLILDLIYIEKYSVWQDIVIIFQTLKIFFKSDSTEGFDETDKIEFNEIEQDK